MAEKLYVYPSNNFRAKAGADKGEPTIFDKIISKEIPAAVIYEDETALAFKDINPQAPIHFLVIPKQRDGLTQLAAAEERHETILGHLLFVATKVARQGKIKSHSSQSFWVRCSPSHSFAK